VLSHVSGSISPWVQDETLVDALVYTQVVDNGPRRSRAAVGNAPTDWWGARVPEGKSRPKVMPLPARSYGCSTIARRMRQRTGEQEHGKARSFENHSTTFATPSRS